MPFIPHTEKEIKEMLKTIGVESIEKLFDEIPSALRIEELQDIPEGMNEMSLSRLMQERASQDEISLNFIGAGAYEHYIPAAIWDITARGEFMTSYTPYQAEASQGTLQLLYEYQTMMANLMGMEVSNASMYDGSTALAEAILMAVRLHKSSSRRILLPSTVHPYYRQVVKTIVESQNIELIDLPYSKEQGTIANESIANESLEKGAKEDITDITALVIPHPNFFGKIEEVHALTDFAHKIGALVIGVVNPIAMALLSPPGEWGEKGADIACGEGQPLGVPLAGGGPYFGFLCCKKEFIRQMPGRLIGRTRDVDGKTGFTLTLQAREQHIRRAKATSNICTNQGLLVTAATIYMSLLGAEGLIKVATASHQTTEKLYQALQSIEGVQVLFKSASASSSASSFSSPSAAPFFHELVLRFNTSVDTIIASLATRGIQAGFDLRKHYPELGECLLVCVTETKTDEDILVYSQALKEVLEQNKVVTC